MVALSLAMVPLGGSLDGGPATAAADAFYVCTKRGKAPLYLNEARLASARRDGWRCRKRMQFNEPSTRRQRTGGTARSGSSSAPSTVRAPRRFIGPAGEREAFEPHIQEAARRYNVPPDLVRAVIRVESNFRPQAVSHAGARGLMQLMPRTAESMGVSDIFDPRQNIFGGVRYLRVLINKFEGDARLAIAAYHAGPGIVSARGGIPYQATERYVRSVLTHYFRYRDARL